MNKIFLGCLTTKKQTTRRNLFILPFLFLASNFIMSLNILNMIISTQTSKRSQRVSRLEMLEFLNILVLIPSDEEY